MDDNIDVTDWADKVDRNRFALNLGFVLLATLAFWMGVLAYSEFKQVETLTYEVNLTVHALLSPDTSQGDPELQVGMQ